MSKKSTPAHSPDATTPSSTSGVPSFAKFWRCALQVNPWTYLKQYRNQDHGLDEDAYNRALVEKCQALGIKVVGIADHGSVESVDKLRKALNEGGIVAFPGFEITSTEKVHMVCLFPEETTKDALNRYLGKLDLLEVERGEFPSRLGCLELATTIRELGGFWYAAHTTNNNGLLRLNSKDGGGLVHVWRNSELVRVAQIPGRVDDLPENYRAIIENRNPDYLRERPIVVIRAADVGTSEDLEKPAASCWVKMTQPGFEAFQIAFRDPESRIRLDIEPAHHGFIESILIQGGYLDGLEARFSENLNALIGGRGTGKSTLLECLRYALELSPKGKQAARLHLEIVKENLGKQNGAIELAVSSAVHHGRRFTISRRFGEPPIVRDDSGSVSQLRPLDLLPKLEVYGQNEIYELAQDVPSRMRLLERFLPVDRDGTEKMDELRRKLGENKQQLEKARGNLDEVEERVARLPRLGEELKGYQALGVEAKLASLPLFEREKQIVERVGQEVEGLEEALEALRDSLPDLAFLSDKALEGLPNAATLAGMRASLETLAKAAEEHRQALLAAVETAKRALEPEKAEWQGAVEAGERELRETLNALPAMAGKSGREVGTAFRELTQEIERIKPLEAKKKTLEQLVAASEQERANLIAGLSDLRTERAQRLQRAIDSLNRRLEGKLRIELRVEGDYRRLKQYLVDCKLEGVGEKRLVWVEEKQVKPLALARAIRKGGEKLRAELGLTSLVAEALAKLPYSKLLELEALELDDEVSIELNVAHAGAEPQFKKLEHLSTGQQCTAILHLLLMESPDPLVVDQPEDNLDNAFIAERIVRELREAKTRRQFLFSTHNANIPVFGDAEWIGVLSASENRGALEYQGSIDVPEIREQAEQILEGGREAFARRREMYEL
jgi:DNA repair ATPase RecN